MSFLLSLLGVGRMIRQWAGVALGFAARYPWQAACLILAAVAALGWHGDHKWHQAYTVQHDTYAAAVSAGKAATLAAQAKYHTDATETQHDYENALSVAQDRTGEYIRTHRLQNCSVPAPAGAQGGTASVPAISPADTIVVGVESGDVRTCTADHTYAQSAYELGQRLIRDGLAQ